MPGNSLTPAAQSQNASTLAAALGLANERAAELLDLTILITVNPDDEAAWAVACDVRELLGRTVREITTQVASGAPSAELVIGDAEQRSLSKCVFLQLSDEGALITAVAPRSALRCTAVHRLVCALVSCYACAALLNQAIEVELPFGLPENFDLRYDALGIDLEALVEPIELGHAYLAGAGAIGNGLLWAARHLNLRGRLEIADDDHVDSGNLNRQIWFGTTDINQSKAKQLAANAQPFFQHLALIPRVGRLQDLEERTPGPWLARLIVAVDSRRARRSLQNEIPGEVFDASTTDIREVVIHHHRQPTNMACMSCIYKPDTVEFSREAHIADHMGVSVEEVRSERIDPASAAQLQARFPTLAGQDIVGLAYDSLFRSLCGEGALKVTADREQTAPFAFVSCLAGVYLAFELVRRLGRSSADRSFNYWRLSAWHPPLARGRQLRARSPECPFCSNEILRRVSEDLWSRQSVGERIEAQLTKVDSP